MSQWWGHDDLLNVRAGRMYIPFCEEYLNRNAVDNPLILHSVADFWGVDPGLEIYGNSGKFKLRGRQRRILRRPVDTTSDGENALNPLRQNNYDVTFCDWKMPGLNGRQIYERLQATNPDQCRRIVFFSGEVVNGPMRIFLEHEQRVCLAKPFTFMKGALRD